MAAPSIHFRDAARILGEDREVQVAAVLVEALRRFRPAGAVDYRPVAKHLSAEVLRGRVLTAKAVRDALVTFHGVEHRAGAIAAYWRQLG